MTIMNTKVLSSSISRIRGNTESLRTEIHEVLIACAYYAMKDGNVTPFNDLLDAVAGTVRQKGITLWAETFAPCYIKQGKFAYSKKTGSQISVSSPEDFAPFEAEMRLVKWWTMAPKEKVKSIFDPVSYLDGVIRHLEKHNVAQEVIAFVRQAEGKAMVALAVAKEEAEARAD